MSILSSVKNPEHCVSFIRKSDKHKISEKLINVNIKYSDILKYSRGDFMRLKELREDNDITQAEIAKILNCRQNSYSNWEREIHEIPLESLKRLCLFYNVSADYILGLPAGLPYPKR